ncbi:unnamed protein product [Phaedon cochleariae]|uniref:MD-2-related lipid-recognition domain-containing protein n=1 Tax=Phaedon cochleariae TaxID=80249 RepID=A0A9P0GU56_PHACE|nr:unnamed protein product [Phaedon cochleariae]
MKLRFMFSRGYMTFSFLKCDSSGNPSTCEYRVKDYRNSEVCKYVMMKNQAWSVFTEHFDKPLVCPLKPGDYNVVRCPIKPDFLRLFPVSDAVWKVNIWDFDKGVAISCVDVEIQIKPFFGERNKGLYGIGTKNN